MIIKATATISFEFDTLDGLVENEDDALAELLDYLLFNAHPSDFETTVETLSE